MWTVAPGGSSCTSELWKLYLINSFVCEKVKTKGNKPSLCIPQNLKWLIQWNRNVKAPQYHIHLRFIHLAAMRHIDLGLLSLQNAHASFNEIPIPTRSSSHIGFLLYYTWNLFLSPLHCLIHPQTATLYTRMPTYFILLVLLLCNWPSFALNPTGSLVIISTVSLHLFMLLLL